MMKNNSNYKKVVIISGITSFLGKNTAKYLIENGYIVFGITRSDSKNNDSLNDIEGLKLIQIDFDNYQFDDFDKIKNSKIYEKIEYINSLNLDITFIHYAWQGTNDRNNFELQMLNVDMSMKFLLFANLLNVNKFIFAGSQAEKSDSSYGLAKTTFAERANSYINNSKMKMQFIHLRIFSIYGYGDNENTLISKLITNCKNSESFDLGPCDYLWNYLYIDDYVKILENIISKKIKTNILDIGSYDTRFLKDYVIAAKKIINKNCKLNFDVLERSDEVFSIPDIRNLIQNIGEYKFIDFNDGIKRIVKQYNTFLNNNENNNKNYNEIKKDIKNDTINNVLKENDNKFEEIIEYNYILEENIKENIVNDSINNIEKIDIETNVELISEEKNEVLNEEVKLESAYVKSKEDIMKEILGDDYKKCNDFNKCEDVLYIIIPTYNEEANIKNVVNEWYEIIEKYNGNNCSKLVIINDGSTDNTFNIVNEMKNDKPLLEVINKDNSGHGRTLLYGYDYALKFNPNFIFQTDSDGQTSPDEFENFWNSRNDFDAIIGHRNKREDGFSRIVVTKVLKFIVNIIFGINILDANCPFRLIKSNVLKDSLKFIPSDCNLSNIVLSVVLYKKNYNVKFIPISFKCRQGGINSINLIKIIKIGIKSIFDFIKINKNII